MEESVMRLAFSFIVTATLACAASSVRADTLRIGILADPATLDPAQSSSVTDRVVFAGFCDKLIDLDDKLHYVPQLATAWTWGTDGLSLTLKLREGVVFQDGTPFDAEAVRFNFERDKTAPYSRRKTELKPVRAVTVVDSHTVRLDLSEPYVPLLAQLADRSGMMVSPKAARELGDKFGSHPVCAGPYRFVERIAQDRIVFDKFAQYWNKGAVSIDRVVYLPIPDDTVRLANLRAGGLQIIERVSPTDLSTLRSDTRVRLGAAPSVGYRVLSINTNKGPAAKASLGTSAQLREAFELSLDRDAINQAAFDGAFVPSNQPEPPGSTYYDKALPVPARDLARAKAIVAASGKSKIPVMLLVSTDPLDGRVAQIIQAMAGEAGFDVKIEVTESASLLARLKSGNYEMALLIWSGRPDPDANISMWVACDGFINWGSFCDPKLDAILKQARSAADTNERAKLYAQAAAIYLSARPYIFLYHLKWYWGLSARLDGFVPHPDGIVRLTGLHLRP
jgi:peptide/nickel transport system substrate-binding protein